MLESTYENIVKAQQGNTEVLESLVKNNMGLVYNIAKRFVGRGYEIEDLNQIGAISNFVNPNYFKINSKKYINDTHSKLLIIMDRFYGPLKESISQTNIINIMVLLYIFLFCLFLVIIWPPMGYFVNRRH